MVSLKVDRLIGSAWCHSIEPVCGSSVGTTSDRLLVSMTYDMGAVKHGQQALHVEAVHVRWCSSCWLLSTDTMLALSAY